MKKLFEIGLALSAASLLLGGCVKEDFSSSKIPEGNGIVFGANANYAGRPDTKTEYGDYEYDNGSKVSQAINWLATDKVDIYSPTSPIPQVEYGVGSGGSNTTYLVATGEYGLQWAGTTQDFYAVYPAMSSIENEAVKNLVSFKDGVLTGYVPINQQHTITKGGATGYTATPNMDYLWMSAVLKGFPVPSGGDNGTITLDFVPLTTTLEITIVGPTETPLASLNVEANGVPVVGQFKCDLNGYTPSAGKYPVCESLQEGTTNDYATVSLYYNDGGINKPLSLAAGESVTLNVFLLPTASLDNVTIRIAGFNTSSRTMKLQSGGTNITLTPHMKTCVKIPAPQINAGGTNEWISGINDNVLVSQLSIPGTANTFSYEYTGSDKDWYQTQTAEFEQQWNSGIRCFELKGPEIAGDLGNSTLQCNRQDIGVKFADAVDMIWQKIQASPGEFAIIIPAYESNSGHGSDGAAVTKYANALNTFFANHNYDYITYNRTLTVGQARGKLMFIARITSEEDETVTLPAPQQGVFIKGWGSLKDLWGRRGYNINGVAVSNWAKNSEFSSSMEYYMLSNSSVAPEALPSRDDNMVNFYHGTVRADGTSSEKGAYIQDWNRVVPESTSFPLYNSYSGSWFAGYDLEYTHYAYWQESMGEKKNDVWNTFMAAIADNSGQQGEAFYINNLDGYYVDAGIDLSYKPYVEGRSESYTDDRGYSQSYGYGNGGVAGNISAYATDINEYFYNAILDYGQDNIYGPMNIVLMDKVYADDPSSYLPSVIINNNYRFPLITSDDVLSLQQ